MNRSVVQGVICWVLLLGHTTCLVAAPLTIIDFNRALDVILILLPLTGALLLIIVQYYIDADERAIAAERVMSSNSAALFVFIAVVFVALILGIQVLYYQGKIADLDTLKRAVSVADTAFGAFIAIIVKSLFKI
jgi:hypothetical protein